MAEVTYYFNARGDAVWTNPDNIVDNNLETFGSTSTNGASQLLNGNDCPATDLGTTTKVEIRLYGYGDGDDRIDVTPVFAAGDGAAHQTTPDTGPPGTWGAYVNITNDPNAPDWSSWAHVQDLDCKLAFTKVGKGNTVYCAKVEIRVTYEVEVGPPWTIVNSGSGMATRWPQHFRVFKNPRGQAYYYALITTSDGVRLYKAPPTDLSAWSLVSTLSADPAFVGSLDAYDDGSQLVVYLTYGAYESWFTKIIGYRRLVIPDDTSDPTIGSEQTVITAGTAQGVPVIKRDRNGYVHIAYMADTVSGAYHHASPRIVGTTTTNPGDAPYWAFPAVIEDHPAIEYSSYFARCSLVVFGGTGNIGGVVYAMRNGAGVITLRGRNIVSFDGASYSLGTASAILSSEVSTHADCSVAFRATDDIGNYAHLATEATTSGALVKSLKASATSTVESWEAPVTVADNLSTLDNVSLSIDRAASPNVLYAFYGPWVGLFRYRSSPVDTISWSDETSVEDDTAMLNGFNSCYKQVGNGVQVTYQRSISPYAARFHEVSVAPLPPAYPFHRRTLKEPAHSGRRGFDEITGHRRGFWPT